ncbi:MAG: hypothetical protein FJ148_04605 [Deltaproteobacteria bacterium]|nr:hypothetical protein [Deltaproteobacteria bacterium]
MSTILDALRKAQEDTGGKQTPVGEHPAANAAVTPARRARRRFGWPVVVAGILAVAFAGGLALGDRIVALFGGSAEAPQEELQLASRAEDVAVAGDTTAAPPPVAEAPAPTPVVRRGRRPAQAADMPPPGGFAQTSETLLDRSKSAPETAPTPYGQLHVFGAGEVPSGAKRPPEDRLERLRQLREKMQKARRGAVPADGQGDSAPKQIFVPPPRESTPAEVDRGNAGTTVASGASDPSRSTLDRGEAPSEPVAAAPVEVAPADADRSGGGAVGGPETDARAESEVAQPEDGPTAAPEEPTAVAAVRAPEPPAPVLGSPPPAASPPVLRRAPGGAPQVAINILQWSADPGRRFAFVSVDGGNMTQVREGDHIGGLTIKHIHQQMIEFGFNDSTFLLRAN